MKRSLSDGFVQFRSSLTEGSYWPAQSFYYLLPLELFHRCLDAA